MMTARRVMNYIAAEPFRPFRISMASGQSYDIRHPEMIAVGRTTVHVFTSMSDDFEEGEEAESKEQERELSILLIESIEPLDTAAKSGRG